MLGKCTYCGKVLCIGALMGLFVVWNGIDTKEHGIFRKKLNWKSMKSKVTYYFFETNTKLLVLGYIVTSYFRQQ